jgi:hypothetical protein
MPNMSYCRFENTSLDVLDCVEQMQEHAEKNGGRFDLESFEETLSEHERQGLERLLEHVDTINEMLDTENQDD